MDNTRRKLEIIHQLVNSGIIDFMNDLVSSKLRHGKFTIDSKKEIEYAKKLRLALEKLGPVFVKFGQLLSSRRDIFSDNIVEELQKLQDDISVLEFSKVKETFYQDFGKDIDEVFVDFNPKALASGSIAQTYRAKIRHEGQYKDVCVKILREDTIQIIQTDTKIMLDLARKYSSRLKKIKTFDLVKTIEEFSKSLFKEINFKLEKDNLKKFYGLNQKDKYVHSPFVYEDYCTDRVLTMEFIDAKSIRYIKKYPQDFRKDICQKLVYSYVNQCFSYGYFQADPHPGNIFVDDNRQAYLLDFGIVGSLSENNRFQIMKIFVGASFNQVKLISDAVISMGLIKSNFSKIADFEKRIQAILDNYLNLSLHEIKISDLIEEFFDLLTDFEIQIPAELTNFGKTIFSLEGLIAGLIENESFVELAYPIAKRLIIKTFKPKNLLDRISPKVFDLLILLKDSPKFSLSILRQLSSGNFSIVNKKSKQELDMIKKNEKRKSFAIVFLAFSILFSSLLITISLSSITINNFKSIVLILLGIVGLAIIYTLFKFFRI